MPGDTITMSDVTRNAMLTQAFLCRWAEGQSGTKPGGSPSPARCTDRRPDPEGGEGHVDVLDAERPQRIHDGVHYRRRRRDGAAFTHAFDAHRIVWGRRDRAGSLEEG